MKLQRLLGALCAGLMLLSLPARATEQSSYVTPVAGPMSMATFAGTHLNPALRALASCHNGTSAPANGPSSLPLAYQCWVDTTANPALYKIYDGASWITLGAINTTTHVWLPYLTGGTSGGVPFFSAANVMGSSALLSQYGFMVGGGAGAAPSTIAACTNDQIAFGQASNSPLCRTVTGDITFSAGTSAIGANRVTNSLLRQSAAISLVGNSTNATANVGDISAAAASDCVFRESSSTLGCGTIATNGLANNAITNAKFRQSPGLSVVGNSTVSTANIGDMVGTADQVMRIAPAGASAGFGSIDLSKSGAIGSSLLALANGGCNAALTASNGGILWSNSTQCQILAGTATARLPLLSGATAAPVWGAYTLPASITSGGIPYFSSISAESSSALLTANAIMLGGGAGTAPATLGSLGTTTTVLHGNAAGAPTFGAIVAADITANALTNATFATMAAYTIKANATGSAAAPTDVSIPALTQKASPVAADKIMIADSAASDALKYATVSSLASAGSVASIAGNTGAFTLSNGIINSTNDIRIDTGNLPGVSTNSNAAAGKVGEYISSSVPAGSAVSLTTSVVANVTSISLTAGDWDVSGNIYSSNNAATTATIIIGNISLVSATLPTNPNGGAGFDIRGSFSGGNTPSLPVGTMRLSLASTTTVYLVVDSVFSGGTAAAFGFIGARRMR